MANIGGKVFWVLVVGAAVIAVLFGALISVYAANSSQDQLTLQVDGSASENMSISLDNICPGQTRKYEISVNVVSDGYYTVSVEFLNAVLGGMEQYIEVRMDADDEQFFGATLAECFETEPTEYSGNISASRALKFTIYYTMPENVSNDAQMTTVDFDLKITVEGAGN